MQRIAGGYAALLTLTSLDALELTLAKFENAPYKTVRPKLNVSQYKLLILLT